MTFTFGQAGTPIRQAGTPTWTVVRARHEDTMTPAAPYLDTSRVLCRHRPQTPSHSPLPARAVAKGRPPSSLQPLHQEAGSLAGQGWVGPQPCEPFPTESRQLPAALQARLPNMGLEGWPRCPARHGPWRDASPGSVPSASGPRGSHVGPVGGGGQFSQETLQGEGKLC